MINKNLILLVFQRKLVGIGYSGTNSADEKIMGLTSACPSKPISKIDPMLTWVVPAEWKLTEAATVPVVYTHVIIQLATSRLQNFFLIKILWMSQKKKKKSTTNVILGRTVAPTWGVRWCGRTSPHDLGAPSDGASLDQNLQLEFFHYFTMI